MVGNTLYIYGRIFALLSSYPCCGCLWSLFRGLDKVDIYYCGRGKKNFFLSKKHISHIANYTICCIFVAIVNLVTLLYQDI